MARTCSSCGFSPIGPFVDNCPMCAEPVRYARGGGGGRARWGNLSWLKRVLVGIVVAVVCTGGCCGLGLWQLLNRDFDKEFQQAKAEMEAARRARTVAVSTEELLREFQNDPEAANLKYKGKCLELSGIVERSGRDGNGIPFVVLHAGDERAKLRIECFFEFSFQEDDHQFERPVKGQTVTLTGEYAGQVSHVQLRQCLLVK